MESDSNQINELESILTELKSIDPKEVKVPAIPIGTYLQEAENLYQWATADKEALEKVNLDWSIVESIQIRTSACRNAQALWQKEYREKEEAQRLWTTQEEELYELRDGLIHSFLFAFRKNSEPLETTRRIAEGVGHADAIQDLADLAVLGIAYPDELTLIAFDINLLTKAQQLSESAADLLASANGARTDKNEEKELRDRAYTYLKQAVDEIRDYGKFVFLRTPDRLKGYRSEYIYKKNKKKANKD